MADPPAMIVCGHGSRSDAARVAMGDLIADLRLARPQIAVEAAYVDLEQPNPQTAVERLEGRPAVLVPALLTAGYHVRVDLTQVADRFPSVTLAEPLSPHPRVVDLLLDRLTAAAGQPPTATDQVLLVSAGSSDPAAIAACDEVARSLGDRLAAPVGSAYVTAAAPDVATAVAAATALRRPGSRVLVALHLLIPGHFTALAGRQARLAGADAVGEPLLAPGRRANPALVEVALERYDAATATS